MNSLVFWFVLTVVVTGLFGWQFTRRRVGIVLMAALFALFWFAYADLMGRSKPLMLPGDEIVVLSYHLDEGEAIHLWLLDSAPRAYRMPWNMDEARELRDGMDKAEEAGVKLMMRRGLPDGEFMFYPEPQSENPPKTQ